MRFKALLACLLFAATLACAQDKKADKSKDVVDPVCGMTVNTGSAAAKSDYKGKTYYFCSMEDKKEFDKSPANYIKEDQDKDKNKKK